MNILAQLRTARQLLIEMGLGDSKRAKELDKIILQAIDNLVNEL